jgi:hypothetical protein
MRAEKGLSVFRVKIFYQFAQDALKQNKESKKQKVWVVSTKVRARKFSHLQR